MGSAQPALKRIEEYLSSRQLAAYDADSRILMFLAYTHGRMGEIGKSISYFVRVYSAAGRSQAL
jgi:hypothetical protein